ncbi:MAG: hypothetical protein WBO82_08855 [Neisseria sp.]
MKTLSFQANIATRMLENTVDEHIHPEALFIQTANGYWLAWHDGTAAVLSPNTPAGQPCDWVEGAESLQELVAMLESGEYDEIVEFEGDDEEWAQLNNACHADHHHHKPHTSDS